VKNLSLKTKAIENLKNEVEKKAKNEDSKQLALLFIDMWFKED
jgi:hypothetical protein